MYYRFESTNKGCGLAVGGAISWAFENEDQLIILEDDCIPSLAFFDFSSQLLEKYKDDERIWVVTGLNHFNGKFNLNNEDSYFFSKYSSIWGWATWKRCWQQVDLNMKNWELFKEQGYIFDHVARKDGKIAWEQYNSFYNYLKLSNNPHNWDTQLGFSIWSNRGVGITPAENLIKNIGMFGTHSNKSKDVHNISISDDFKITKHPDFFQTNHIYDDRYFSKFRKKKTIIFRLIKKVLNLFKLK